MLPRRAFESSLGLWLCLYPQVTQVGVWVTHQVRVSLLLGVEEEGAEDGKVEAVGQHGEVGLCELEGGAMLLLQLPHTV